MKFDRKLKMIELKPFPIRYEALNDLYEHTDQSCCLNRVAVPLEEATTRGFFLAVRTKNNGGLPFDCRGIYLDGKLIGKIELTRYEDYSAELDLILETEYTGNGYGKEALEQFQNDLRKTGWAQCITAYVKADHKRMIRVLEKTGFEPTRAFAADVMTPQNGTYVLRTVNGIEYSWKNGGNEL